MKKLFIICLTLIVGMVFAQTCPAPPPPPPSTGIMWGLTFDDISNTAGIVKSLSKFAVKPTARVVFDPGMPASYYRSSLVSIHGVAGVLGTPVDSSAMKRYNGTTAYVSRFQDYVANTSDVIDIYEICNECNGNWLGSGVSAKMAAAYDYVTAQGKPTMLTLYYDIGCEGSTAESMWNWTAANVPARMYTGLTYVTLSFYPSDCSIPTPNWQVVFDKLHNLFPNSKIGFSESDSTSAGGTNNSVEVAYINSFYGIRPTTPNFIGFYGLWYAAEEVVPCGSLAWGTINKLMGGLSTCQ
jgi:hypothetical protein